MVPGWSLVGALETGFDPYSGNLVNGPRSLVQNNGEALTLQNANSDLSRAGQFDNSVGYIGPGNQTFGTLTVGRVTSLTLDGVIAYDPMGGSYASLRWAIPAPTPASATRKQPRQHRREDRVAYENFHGGAWCSGPDAQGNGMTGLYQGDIGAHSRTALAASVRGPRRQRPQNAVGLPNFTGTCAMLASGPFKGDNLPA